MKKVEIKTNFDLSGRYRFVSLKAKPKWIPVKVWLALYHAGLLESWVIRRGPVIENHVVFNEDHGVNLVIQHLGGIDTYPLELNLAAIGTGTTPPTDEDEDLETPVVTGIIRATVQVNLDNIVTEWFMTDDELPAGEYTEFALYAGTQMFTRSLVDPSHTKADGEDTLVEYTVAGNNS